ncbi:MAG: PAC2 family protein [Anaerolineae bacterium]|nr:PAC2 family protein [Anaerolineae bacterium]
MAEPFSIFDPPQDEELYMIAGWRQWVDGGAVSSGLPRYLRRKFRARRIAEMDSHGYYLFQLPGTQHFMRPIVRHNEGHPEGIHTPRNQFHYTSVDGKGLIIFSGEEPHLDVERYSEAFLNAARALNVKRIVISGGIYGEVPYDKERFVTSIFSLPHMRKEVSSLVVNLSNYQGPGSIGSYICQRAGENEIELVGLYTFSPIFQLANMDDFNENLHIEKDYMAWLGVMRRVNHMFGFDLDLTDLESRASRQIKKLDEKVAELDEANPELGVRDYIQRISDEFEEETFTPLEDVWQEELRRLGDKYE